MEKKKRERESRERKGERERQRVSETDLPEIIEKLGISSS